MSAAHLPYLKWYPTDWRADPRLRMCSLAARGLWIELIGYMHEGEPYGHLTINGTAPAIEDVASLVGRPLSEVRKAWAELEQRQVFSRDRDEIFSRRMVRDKAKSDKDRANGKGGGNPKLRGEDNGGVNPPVKAQKPEATSKEDRIGDASARPSSFTEVSKALASAFWKALGFESALAVPPDYAGTDWRAIEWEKAGWTVDLIDAETRRIGPDKPLTYYEKVFATSFAKRQAPLPIVEIREAEKVTVAHGTSQNRSGGSLTASLRRDLAALEQSDGADNSLPVGRLLRLSN